MTVTALVRANPDEGIRLINLVLPLEIAGLTALVGWLLGCLFSGRRSAQNLVALVFVFVTLIPGYLFGWADVLSGRDADLLRVLLALLVFAVAVPAIHVTSPGRDTARFLNLMSGVLMLLTLPAVARLVDGAEAPLPAASFSLPPGTLDRPDIFLITLDAYTGARSLNSVYGFDNAAMFDSLRRRDFRIPTAQTANYPNTFLSVGSMLNRDYADDLAATAAPEHQDRRRAYAVLEFNQTAVDLMANGYAFYYVGSSYPPMAANRLAAGPGAMKVSREFEYLWLSTTILRPVRSSWRRLWYGDRAFMPFEAEDARSTESRIRQFEAYAGRPGPKFIYMHLMLPHGPFRFGPRCEHRPAAWTVGGAPVADSTARRMYLEQLQCTNRKVLETIDAIHAAAGDSAVILLQADHGFGRFKGDNPSSLMETSGDQVLERLDVFSAYFAPGVVADSLSTVRSPVNLFRTLFRVLWGVDEPPLADRHFWSNPDRPLRFIELDLDSIASN